MKKIILVSLSYLIMSFPSYAGNWEYSKDSVNKVKTYNVFSFDKKFENSLSFSCNEKYKELVVTIVPNQKLINREYSILSFVFDNKEENKVKYKVKYNSDNIWMSSTSLKENKQEKNSEIKYLIENLQTKSMVKVGVVKYNGKSHYFDIDLKGSSSSLNTLLKQCKY